MVRKHLIITEDSLNGGVYRIKNSTRQICQHHEDYTILEILYKLSGRARVRLRRRLPKNSIHNGDDPYIETSHIMTRPMTTIGLTGLSVVTTGRSGWVPPTALQNVAIVNISFLFPSPPGLKVTCRRDELMEDDNSGRLTREPFQFTVGSRTETYTVR